MQVWPAIDLRGGKCVRLQQGDYHRETVFADDPLQVASRWIDQGASCLHLVDLDGARDGRMANRQAVASIVSAVEVPCQLGGGIRDEATIADLLDLGCQRLVIGTRALKEPPWFGAMCQKYPSRLVLGIDARRGWVATDGWRETSKVRATEFAQQFQDVPLGGIVYTDIVRDGMMAGPNFQALAQIRQSATVPVLASGGVTTLEDICQLARLGLAGCIIGRALYEGKLDLPEALRAAGPLNPKA
jgi:phosphoribosylformimino-5-aminoimidazole carboxamide ribotide isomerase